MASANITDWQQLLKGKYPSYKIEVETYLENLEVATSSEISARKIYDAIKDLPEINENLKKIYKEALFGSDKEVKSHIKNRMSNFKRSTK